MKPSKKGLLLVCLGPALVLAAAAVFYFLLRPSGQRADPGFDAAIARPAYTDRHPRLLFDEAHRNFHTSGGRYRPFAELARHDGYEVTPNRQPFSAATLTAADILVIANARGADEQGAEPAFTEAECEAVRAWVEAGGALLLIVDHYPFGPAAAPLARRLGVEVRPGFVEDSAEPNHEAGDTSRLVFSRENGLLADHAIVRGRDASERVQRVVTFTGTSLAGAPGGAILMKLSETAVDLAPTVKVERKGGDTFTYVTYENPSPAAGRAQGLAFEVGKGRAVVLGEAAELTAQLEDDGSRFGMNVPGNDNRQFALNLMHWLSRLLD